MASSVPEIVTAEDLAFFRALALGRMESVATVRRKGPPTTVDGLKVPSWTDVLVDVPFRLGGPAGPNLSRSVTVGNTTTQVAVRTGNFPTDTEGIRDGDVVEITAGEYAGRFLTIVDSLGKDQATALRLPVVQIPKPDGWPS